MPHDPADKTHRKPRQTRGTPLGRYVNLISLGVTLFYGGILYLSYRKNVIPLANTDDTYKKMLEEARKRDYLVDYPPIMHELADKLFWEGLFKPESEDAQKTEQD
ncbi:hypothetical protein X777_16621 [Ooceraea biroi]|uniref:Uncharacterized protein n=1 Tax=Ooceraea biroi TaxID=2015173 RepID=A0A026VUJ5_OOCBI|nr:hypothetical protein X777_16621 [Ooceraea biroi]